MTSDQDTSHWIVAPHEIREILSQLSEKLNFLRGSL